MLYRVNLPGIFHRTLFTDNSLFFTMILYILFEYYPILNIKVAKSKLLSKVGVVSYELYLIHYIFIKTMDNQNQILCSGHVLVFSILMAFILHFFFKINP
jgi:peptidoglycan/LPS O-acetylase OafA/YrhL